MTTFWGLLRESVIFQGLITIGVVGAWIYMLVTGQEAPEALTNVVFAVVAFFFGSKMQQTIQRPTP